ncbi:MAG: hypothetical protein QW607_10515 [Desulfurococcaceae archaeon]
MKQIAMENTTKTLVKEIIMKIDIDILEHTHFTLCSDSSVYKNMNTGFRKLDEEFVAKCRPALIVETLALLNNEKYDVRKIWEILERYESRFGIRYRYGVYDVFVDAFLGNYVMRLVDDYRIATAYVIRLSDDKKYMKKYKERHKERYDGIVRTMLREILLDAINVKNIKSENRKIAVKVLYKVTRERKYERYLDVYVFIIIYNTEFIELLSSFL